MASGRTADLPGVQGNGRVPPLHNGDRLTRVEFERRYAAMARVRKAELIEGVVHMPSPVSPEHSRAHFEAIGWLYLYVAGTPGVRGGDNETLRLDMDNEPQPDTFLCIEPTHGGQVRLDEDGYVGSAPELILEVAVSSVSIDLHSKLQVYRRNCVREYVVWRIEDKAIDWFILREGRYDPLSQNEGIFKSEVLPGLWLEPNTLIQRDLPGIARMVQRGLDSPEHAAFLVQLQQAFRSRPPELGRL